MNKQIVFLCVGSSKLTGDSLAPKIGDKLIESNLPCYVYGTTSNNVNRKNLDSYLDFINKVHQNCILITIDAGLSKTIPIGSVKVSKGGITPGGAICKKSKKIGDIGILGVVNYYDNDIIKALNMVNEGFILDFSDYIVNLIKNSYNAFSNIH